MSKNTCPIFKIGELVWYTPFTNREERKVLCEVVGAEYYSRELDGVTYEGFRERYLIKVVEPIVGDSSLRFSIKPEYRGKVYPNHNMCAGEYLRKYNGDTELSGRYVKRFTL